MSSSPGCRVPQAAKEPRTTVDWRNIMNADELKKLTTESLDHLSAALAEGHSERLSALLKTMAQFHRYSFHNVCRLCRARHNKHHADSRIMPTLRWAVSSRAPQPDETDAVNAA